MHRANCSLVTPLQRKIGLTKLSSEQGGAPIHNLTRLSQNQAMHPLFLRTNNVARNRRAQVTPLTGVLNSSTRVNATTERKYIHAYTNTYSRKLGMRRGKERLNCQESRVRKWFAQPVPCMSSASSLSIPPSQFIQPPRVVSFDCNLFAFEVHKYPDIHCGISVGWMGEGARYKCGQDSLIYNEMCPPRTPSRSGVHGAIT